MTDKPARITDEMISRATSVVIGYTGEYGTYNVYLSEETAREVLEAALSASEQEPATMVSDEEDDSEPKLTVQAFISDWNITGQIERQLVRNAWDQAIKSVKYKPSRITEEDVREIANNIFGYVGITYLTAAFENWFGKFGGRELLNRLNAEREQEPAVAEPDDLPVDALDAVSEALGDCYDCTRTWSAWIYGTMGPDDFVQVAESAERVEEIARAAIVGFAAAPSHSQQSARTPQDYAIEHAEYMAVNGEQLIEYLNEISDAEEGVLVPDDRFGDYVQGLRCGIHDFRKRRDRCLSHESNQSGGEM